MTRTRPVRAVVWHRDAPLTVCARTPALARRALARAVAALAIDTDHPA